MSYLLDFVKSFDENELKQFRQIAVKGKEEAVRNKYAGYANGTDFNESLLLTTLQLSKSHFDKINSLLLDKALLHFVGKELKNRLDFLLRKQLNGLVLHELKLNEKSLKKQKDKPTLKDFYLQAFNVTILFNFNNFPEKEIAYYCKAYTQLLNKQEEEERYRVLAKHEEVLIRYHYPRKDGTKRREEGLKKLLQWQQAVKSKNLFVAEFAINLGLCSYFESAEPEKGLHYLELADIAARKVYDKISDREKAFILAMSATTLVDISRYEEGIIKYRELFSKFARLASARVYHPFQYVFGLLILKNFEEAEDVMKKYLDPFLKNEHARNFHFDILRLYAIYYLLRHKTEEAGKYLQQLLQFGKEDFTPLGDVLFRLVHNVYCIQTGDYALAADVLKKNMKYIDSKSAMEGISAYKQIFLDLGKVLRFKSKNGSSKKHFNVKEIDMGEGRARLYMQLITLPLQ